MFASEATLSFSPTGIGGRDNRIASQFAIEQNYPNPFNPTTISYRIPREGEVTITIYNVIGQRMAAPRREYRLAGEHRIQIDASDWAAGVYYYKVTYNRQSVVRKMLLVK